MKTSPLCRRVQPPPVTTVDEAELSRFRAWVVGRGYAERTGRLWTNSVRSAACAGAATDDEVDLHFGNLHQQSRCTIRTALREFAAFRELGG